MACQHKINNGWCNHFQCPFPKETEHGYECVDLFTNDGISICEVGEGCLTKCPHSWQLGSNSPQELAAKAVNDKLKEELQQFENEAH